MLLKMGILQIQNDRIERRFHRDLLLSDFPICFFCSRPQKHSEVNQNERQFLY